MSVKTTVWVENNQSVPLRRLVDIENKCDTNVILYLRIEREGQAVGGWFHYDPHESFAQSVLNFDSFYTDDDTFWEGAMARLLQPGEIIHIQHKGE